MPLILGMLCLAFWKQSLAWSSAVINAIAAAKMACEAVDDAGSGWAMLGRYGSPDL